MRSRNIDANNLALLHPEIASEWAFDLNGDVTPDKVFPMSSKKYWWRCKDCGYEWQAFVSNRTLGHGCPKCGRKKVDKYWTKRRIERNAHKGSIAGDNPAIAIEWDTELNDGLAPEKVSSWSEKIYLWKCARCGVEWAESAVKRFHPNKKRPKPFCAFCRREDKGQNPRRISVGKASYLIDELYGKYDDDYSSIKKANTWLNGSDYNQLFVSPITSQSDWKDEIDTSLIEFDEVEETETFRVDCWLNNIKTSNSKDLFVLPEKIESKLDYEKKITLESEPVKEQKRKKKADKTKPSNNQKHVDITRNPYNHIVWWECQDCHHQWQKSYGGFLKNQYCPFCNSQHTNLLKNQRYAKNSIMAKRPDLLQYWNYDRNNRCGHFPEWESVSTNTKYWWFCPKCGRLKNLSVANFDRTKEFC